MYQTQGFRPRIGRAASNPPFTRAQIPSCSGHPPRQEGMPRLRPEILFPLFASATSLAGIGPRFAKLFETLAGPAVVDLLWHLPIALVDRRFAPKVREAPGGSI